MINLVCEDALVFSESTLWMKRLIILINGVMQSLEL
uniref:Uncharacterized protein n=1 Tax=Rhizophora mucronata TaxID=61149 RepID=A0A2P2Q4C6_RHIMU